MRQLSASAAVQLWEFTCACRRLELPTSQPTWFPTKRASSHKVEAKGCSPFTNHGSESQKTGTQLQRLKVGQYRRKCKRGVGALPVAYTLGNSPKGESGPCCCKWNTTWAWTCFGNPRTYTCPATIGTTSKVYRCIKFLRVILFIATCTVWMSAATIIPGGTDWACSRLRAFFFQ